jgi:AhpD family alkylhydroperoxidase
MPLVRPISEEEATGKVKAVYDDILTSRKLAKVPPFWKAIASNPDYLEATWNTMKVVMADGRLDRKTKEMIAVAVSATNNCDYCIRSHTDVLRALGVDDETLTELMSVVFLFNGTNAIASGLKIEYEPAVRAE